MFFPTAVPFVVLCVSWLLVFSWLIQEWRLIIFQLSGTYEFLEHSYKYYFKFLHKLRIKLSIMFHLSIKKPSSLFRDMFKMLVCAENTSAVWRVVAESFIFFPTQLLEIKILYFDKYILLNHRRGLYIFFHQVLNMETIKASLRCRGRCVSQ